jgi:23S rRNA pseudouridine1911/1915/1917 synthase
MQSLFPIIYEDDELLVINKPAGLVCHPTKGDATSSLIGRIRLYLGHALNSPNGPAVAPQMINRLDRETSGVVMVAKQQEPARELRRLWEAGLVQKHYIAIVHGHVPERHARIDAPLGRDRQSRVAIKDRVCPDGAPALTEFIRWEVFVRQNGLFSSLHVFPKSGRKHQIRIHLAHYGHPIVGDKLYGHDEQCYLDFVAGRLSDGQKAMLLLANHALHARSVTLNWRGNVREFAVEPEESLVTFVREGVERRRGASGLWNPNAFV